MNYERKPVEGKVCPCKQAGVCVSSGFHFYNVGHNLLNNIVKQIKLRNTRRFLRKVIVLFTYLTGDVKCNAECNN